MIVDDVANLIRYNIVDKLKATPVHTEYDTVSAEGVDIVNEMWECPGMRKLHLETGHTQQFGKLSVLHCVLFPDPGTLCLSLDAILLLHLKQLLLR